jgi:hypothetical protein
LAFLQSFFDRFARVFLVCAALFAFVPLAPAQTSAPRHFPTARKYCHESLGFCFWYPTSWKLLGEVFDGNGVVIAPDQNDDRALWDVITVAMVAPSSESGGATLDGLIDRATSAMRDAGQNFETLQRQERSVAGNPAQLLKARYRETKTERDWIEELVFIEGPQNEVYSVGLKCAPDHLAKLEPAFNRVLTTWKFADDAALRLDRAPAPPH